MNDGELGSTAVRRHKCIPYAALSPLRFSTANEGVLPGCNGSSATSADAAVTGSQRHGPVPVIDVVAHDIA